MASAPKSNSASNSGFECGRLLAAVRLCVVGGLRERKADARVGTKPKQVVVVADEQEACAQARITEARTIGVSAERRNSSGDAVALHDERRVDADEHEDAVR